MPVSTDIKIQDFDKKNALSIGNNSNEILSSGQTFKSLFKSCSKEDEVVAAEQDHVAVD